MCCRLWLWNFVLIRAIKGKGHNRTGRFLLMVLALNTTPVPISWLKPWCELGRAIKARAINCHPILVRPFFLFSSQHSVEAVAGCTLWTDLLVILASNNLWKIAVVWLMHAPSMCDNKVQIFWEGQKILKKIFHLFWHYEIISNYF
jgi:hypothetical protein